MSATQKKPTQQMAGTLKEKKLRTGLTWMERWWMSMMPLSQACSWALVLGATASPEALPVDARFGLWAIAVFHTLWAMRNFFFVTKMEKGMFTYGAVAAGCWIGEKKGLRLAALGSVLVFLSFAFVATIGVAHELAHAPEVHNLPYLHITRWFRAPISTALGTFAGVLVWPVSKLAYVRSKTVAWAYTYKCYMVSNLLLWAYIIYVLAARPVVFGW